MLDHARAAVAHLAVQRANIESGAAFMAAMAAKLAADDPALSARYQKQADEFAPRVAELTKELAAAESIKADEVAKLPPDERAKLEAAEAVAPK